VTTVAAKAIPEGSYELRVFHGEDVPGIADIETVLVLENLGGGVCEAALAHGHLYDEANVLIGLKAYELGFTELRFSVLRGRRATRHADFIGSDERFDFYRVDLPAVIDAADK